jgi:hypothetical protein
MTRYAMLTDQPERLRRAYGTRNDWSVTPFGSAVSALIWERRLRREGAIVLESRGWQFGVVFTRVADTHPGVAASPATSGGTP